MNVLWRRKKWYGVKNGIRILPSLSRSLVPFTVISGKKGTMSTFNRWNDVISCWYDGNFVNHEYEMSATAVLLECWLTACKLCLSLDLDIHIVATINLRFFPSRFWPLCAFGNVQKGFSLSYGKFSRDLMPVVLMDVVVVNHVIMWWSTSIYDREKKRPPMASQRHEQIENMHRFTAWHATDNAVSLSFHLLRPEASCL